MERTLIIEIPYGGLGDHLFHSHIPRIAKETGKYDKVLISNKSLYRHQDNKFIVWDLNPYLDGFVDAHGIKIDFNIILLNIRTGCNLLDEIMYYFNLDDGIKWHEPEIYYKPKFVKEYHKAIFDPNFLSWVGKIDKKDMMWFFKKKQYLFEAIMKIRTEKALYIAKPNDSFIDTLTIQDFCDLIYSSKELFCLTSGTATLASAMGKHATVFYGLEQHSGYRHSKFHEYAEVEQCPENKFLNLIKKIVKKTFIYKLYINKKTAASIIKDREVNNMLRKPFVEKFLPKNGIGAELGVLKGYFSSVLFECTNARELHLIDPWYFLSAEWDWEDGNRSTIDAVTNVLQKFKKHIEDKRIFVHIEDDIKVLNEFPDYYFDWVYIDSSHAYEHTKAELLMLLKKVKENGIIAGDDWQPDPNHRHHGVYKAVNEFINTCNYRMIYSNENNLQWAIQKINS